MIKKLVLDAGHGLNTPGKRIPETLPCAPNSGIMPTDLGIREWTLNKRVANYVTQILAPYNLEIRRSDDITGKTDRSLSYRRNKASDADMFISIHHNAGLNGKKGGGVVVYRHTDRPLLEVHAIHLYNAVIMRNSNRGNRAKGVANAKLGVINTSNKCPIALLIECGFMDGPDDVAKIVTEEYAKNTAQGIAEYVLAILQPEVR